MVRVKVCMDVQASWAHHYIVLYISILSKQLIDTYLIVFFRHLT